MAFSKMTESVHNIQDLSDLPNATDGLTASELKAKFDKAGTDLKDYLNNSLTEELDDKIAEIETLHNNLALLVVSIQETMLHYSDIFPVGSIYISVNSTDPGTMFGGTWERIMDTFLLASGSDYEAGSTGGEASVTLTTSQLPPHNHTVKASTNSPIKDGSGSNKWPFVYSASGTLAATNNTGGGEAHNNMPPYLAVYVWKRIY